MRGADLANVRRSGRPALRSMTPVTGRRVAAFGDVLLGAVKLHVLPQRARVGVALVTAPDLAHVGFITGVDVGVLLPVAAVRESPVAALKLAFKRFFT